MGSDPGDGYPSKYEYYDDELGEWQDKRLNPRKEAHICTVKIGWKPEGRENFVSWEFNEDTSYDVAKVAWLLEDPEVFSAECAPSNVSEEDAENARDIICSILDALNDGDRAALDNLKAAYKKLCASSGRDSKRAQFVDYVRRYAIGIKSAAVELQDKRVAQMLNHISADDGKLAPYFPHFSGKLSTLDVAKVKSDVLSIDPNSKGGKPGAVWLAARLIADANAGDDFEIERSGKSDDVFFEHIQTTLANACRRGRGKPKASGKEP